MSETDELQAQFWAHQAKSSFELGPQYIPTILLATIHYIFSGKFRQVFFGTFSIIKEKED